MLAAALLAGRGGAPADEEARDAARRAVAIDPVNALGYRMLSEASLRLGDRAGAIATMRTAVSAAPDSWVIHLDLAGALLAQPGGGAEAWQLAKRAAAIAPERAEPHVVLGDLAMRAGDLDKAAAGYADALDRAPGDLVVTRKLAELHHLLAAPTQTMPAIGPEPAARTPRYRGARVLGNCLSILAILAAATAGMLLALVPPEQTTWYRVVAAVAGAGLLVLAALLLAGSAPGWRQLTAGARLGLAVSTVSGGLAVVAGPLSAVAGSVPGLLTAVALGVLGCLLGHLVARGAVRRDRDAAPPVPPAG